MNIQRILLAILVLASTSMHTWAQDKTAKPLQGWLDFLVSDAKLPGIVERIGNADQEKSVAYIAPNAELYIWNNRFANGTKENARLEMVGVPNGDPIDPAVIVIAIIDPNRARGIYMPWARRYVDDVPDRGFIPETMLAELLQ